MIHVTAPTDFAVNVHDGTSWPPRPSAQVVRWVGPTEPSVMGTNDEWRVAYTTGPQTIPNLVEWLVADDISDSDGTDIGTWSAEVGNDATQATGGNQPTVRYSAVNGLKAVEFVAADSNWMDISAFLSGTTSEFTMCLVCKIDLTPQCNILTQDASGYSGDLLFGINPGNNTEYNRMGVSSQSNGTPNGIINATHPSTADTADYHLWTARRSATDGNLKLYLDGSWAASQTLASHYTITNRAWSLGRNGAAADRYFDGRIAELAIWEQAHTSSQLAAIHDYFIDRYNL